MKVTRKVEIELEDDHGRTVHLWETDGWTHITCKVGGEWIVRSHANSRNLALRGAEMSLELLKEMIVAKDRAVESV